MNPKVAIVIVVVIVLLFVAGVSTGAFHQGNTTKGDWVKSLSQTFIHPDPVQFGQVNASPSTCIQNNVLVISAGQACVLHIDGGFNVRRLSMTLKNGTAIVRAIARPESNARSGLVLDDETIVAGARTSIDIHQKGADVTIQCAGFQICRLTDT
jgi:hypothetical protein